EWNKDLPWVDEKPWTGAGVWIEPTPVRHYCKPLNYKTRCSEWPTCSWKNDGYCNGGNLPGAYIVGDLLHYQDYEWYEVLKDSELKEQALRNKAIMEGLISDDESSNDGWRRWEIHEITYYDHDELEYENELMMKDKNYVKLTNCQYEYDDLAKTKDDACRAFQEIFRMMDEGWMDLVKEISMNIGGEFTNLEI
ncbi:hypothetical protein Tco_0036708, partial [Tanacetum coccineum]